MVSSQLIYFADPMCSWCWGFSPVIDAVSKRFGDQLSVRLILGGLYPGTMTPLDEASKQTIREHWEHVHEASAQPFDFLFFERDGFIYNTEPPSRAVVAVRHLNAEMALTFLKILHHAFYAQNKDVTDRAVLCDLAVRIGISGKIFAKAYDQEEILLETRNDFAITRQTGVSGFPTLLIGSEQEDYVSLTCGYQPWEKIEAQVTNWLERDNMERP